MGKTTDIGKQSEDIACEYLIQQGYKIIKRNFHFGKLGEIDIIAEKENLLVFIEVKAQSVDTFGDSRFWITSKKQKKLRKVAEGFLFVNKLQSQECRFDVIIIDFRTKPFSVDHIINAFY